MSSAATRQPARLHAAFFQGHINRNKHKLCSFRQALGRPKLYTSRSGSILNSCRRNNAKAQIGKQQSGSLSHRARLHGHELWPRPSCRQAGDDRTDLDAVQEIERMRKGGITALAIVVQHPDTLPELLQQADIVVQKVPGMVDLLREMVEMLETPPGSTHPPS